MDFIRKCCDGFTFIEVLSILLIFSILLGISTFSIGGVYKEQILRTEVFDMYSDICNARNECIATLTQRRVRFYKNYNYSNRSMFQIQKLDNNIWVTIKKVLLPADIRIFSISFPGNATTQIFSYTGTPLYAGSIGVENSEGEILYMVFYTSGRIRIKGDG